MRIKEILAESKHKRSEKNPRLKGHVGAFDSLMHLSSEQLLNSGVTITNIPYPKINPKYRDVGPVGIYFYPAKYYISLLKNRGELPLRHNAPYVNIITWNTDKVLHLNAVDEQQFLLELKKLYKVYDKTTIDQLMNVVKTNMQQSLDDHPIDKPVLDADYSIGKRLWKLTEILAKMNKAKWNSILRSVLGYDIILDNSGIIWWEEDHQGIVLNPAAINHVDVFQQPKISSYSTFQKNKDANLDAPSLNQTLEKIISKKMPFKTLPAHLQTALLDINNLNYGIKYAQEVIKRAWPPLEHTILKKTVKSIKHPYEALAYLTSVRKSPWPELENILKSNPESLALYKKSLSKLS